MTQKQKHTLSMWNLRRSADRTHPHTLSLPTDLTMWSHTIPQLQSLLPAARHLDCTGPSSATFLHEALRNGVDDVNLINAAIWVLEWRFKVSLSDATSYDRELLEEAETKFQKISQSLDHLLTLYLEFPFKTTHKDTIGHTVSHKSYTKKTVSAIGTRRSLSHLTTRTSLVRYHTYMALSLTALTFASSLTLTATGTSLCTIGRQTCGTTHASPLPLMLGT